MKIRTKITLAIGLLLTIISFLGYYAAQSTATLKSNTENILDKNYNSVKYAQRMLWSLYHMQSDSTEAVSIFKKNLVLQERNITENSESQMTDDIRLLFDRYLHQPNKDNLIKLSDSINDIILLNGNAIEQKSETATISARQTLIWMIVLSSICVCFALFMLLTIPKMLTDPIKKLMEGILEISNHNYDKRLDVDDKSEFGGVATSFNKMAQELAVFQQSSMARIISTKQYLEIVINSIDEPIIGIDKQQTVLFANNSASSILNLSAGNFVGKSALNISLSNDLFRRLMKGMEDAKQNEPIKIYADNKESYFEVHYQQLPENAGTVILLSNITRFKELDNAKTNFISVVSHELKTPIAAIMMSLQLMEDKRVGTMNEEQTALAESIKENSNRLLNITGELLKMTQVESGALKLNPKITKPIELINYAIGATRVLAERFKCNVEVDYPETIDKLFVDSEKIAWVVTNLLSNAIHYSQENARVIVGARQKGNNIEIYVRDFGKGIDPRYHKTIFERYFRVPGTKVQGSGLGLAISKDFVEAHGGTIHVESQLGEGSCFTVSLPKA
jgi:signal transduction histidine kinase